MKTGVVIYSNDPETVWNAYRFGNVARAMGDEVRVFLIGKGVKHESLDTNTFKVSEQLKQFLDSGGKVFICGTCLKIHRLQAPKIFSVATLTDLYNIVGESDRIITF